MLAVVSLTGFLVLFETLVNYSLVVIFILGEIKYCNVRSSEV